ncbi:uncharacterized protein LOC131254144 [Magnolia sinica]|uniref:uncharacterized protein LOC131254144 n=1 Tax=Magnolia sinica TaxID=86752 RepID=UPI002658DA0D|nr:uncharacterized protein LOC131254144 [Magnolia sinica]
MTAFAATLTAATTTIAIEEYCNNIIFKSPLRFGNYKRKKIINEIIRAGNNECVAQLQMNKTIFFNLCLVIRDRNLLPDGKHISMEEQLVIFLHTVGHNVRNRVIGHRFIRSGETVSRYLSKAVDAIVGLYPEFVKLPDPEIPVEILANPNWSDYFQDCIGAIDETHIPAYVLALESATYRNKKGVLSQNVMGAYTFNMKFVYVLARWEGSAFDARVLQNALTHSIDRFTIPTGKYYVVNTGYAHSPGFIAPYRGVEYHLNEYRTGCNPSNKKELFNYRYAQLRNVIERIFKIIKVNSDDEMDPNRQDNRTTPTKQPGQGRCITPRRTPRKYKSKSLDKKAISGGVMRWTDEMDDFLIDTLMDMVANYWKSANEFKKETYKTVVETMKSALGISVQEKHVGNRLRTLKRLYFEVRDTLNASGFGWDDGMMSGMITYR